MADSSTLPARMFRVLAFSIIRVLNSVSTLCLMFTCANGVELVRFVLQANDVGLEQGDEPHLGSDTKLKLCGCRLQLGCYSEQPVLGADDCLLVHRELASSCSIQIWIVPPTDCNGRQLWSSGLCLHAGEGHLLELHSTFFLL